MKDECNGVIIREFVGLRPKLYTFLTENEHIEKEAKGVSRDVSQRNITYDDYLQALRSGRIKTCIQTNIQSKNHTIYTIYREKVAIDSHDDKRKSINDYCTLPYGHVALM